MWVHLQSTTGTKRHLPSSNGSSVTSIKSKAKDNYHRTDMFYFILYRRSVVTDVTHLLKIHYST